LSRQGCGIVAYATEEDAQQAIATLNDTELGGRKIFVREDREAQPVAPIRPKRGFRVYVGNLSWNVKWQELKDHMKQVGNVIHADGTFSVYPMRFMIAGTSVSCFILPIACVPSPGGTKWAVEGVWTRRVCDTRGSGPRDCAT